MSIPRVYMDNIDILLIYSLALGGKSEIQYGSRQASLDSFFVCTVCK